MKHYSDWFKVDLHIHTDYSKKTKTNDYQGHFDIAVLKQKLIHNDVGLFSLTDHNIINLDAYREYYRTYEVGDPKLLIGCEFDVEVPESPQTSTYHTLLIFENDTIEDAEAISKKIEDLYLQRSTPILDRRVKIDDLYDMFNGLRYFFIPHAGNNKSIIDPYMKFDIELCQQMVLLMPSAFEKVKESTRQKYNEGFDLLKTYDFKEKDDIPYINFSDNHNCHSYPCTNKSGDDHQFYCIKGQPTFESIRFAFIDPKSRIKKNEEVQVLRRFDNYLHSVKFESNSHIDDATLFFSPNLNVIIGGRSSGKSLLFTILGAKIGNRKHQLDKYKLDVSQTSISSFLDYEYKSGISYNLSDIIYINQGDIVNYFENNSLRDLVQESGEMEDYKASIEFIKSKKVELSSKFERLVEVYGELSETITSNFTLHNRDIESILDASYFFRTISEAPGMSETFDESRNTIERLSEDIEGFKTDRNHLFNEQELAVIEGFQNLVQLKKKQFEIKMENYARKTEFIQQVNLIIAGKNSTLDMRGREKEASNQRIDVLKSKVAEVFRRSRTVVQRCAEIEAYNYGVIQEVNIDSEVSVVLEVEHLDNIRQKVADGLTLTGNNTNLYRILLGLSTGRNKIKNYSDNSADNFRKKLNTQLQTVINSFDYPIEYLKYSEQSTSKNNSPGFNSEKYLKTILQAGQSKIIFIDQPEDNLGNKFITETLIDLIRDLKFKKQIFLVTHNPSIVVYGDAENVIMCVNDENVIKYEQFVLEDKEHQKEICHVLDGGHYIFEQRARKYNIKKLINS